MIERTDPGLGSEYACGSSLVASPVAASGDPARVMRAEQNTGSSEQTSVFGTASISRPLDGWRCAPSM